MAPHHPRNPLLSLAGRVVGRRWTVLGLGWLILGVAQAQPATQAFDLPAGEVETALQQLAAQSGRPVIIPSDLARGIRTPAIRGSFTPQAALDQLLANTPLAAVADAASGAFAIIRRRPPPRLGPPLNAAAFVIIGLTADEPQTDRFRQQAEALRDGFVARGFAPDAVTVLPATRKETARRDSILAALRATKSSRDETWLVLLGDAATARDGAPAFQVSGPRLTVTDLTAAIAALPGKKFVVLAVSKSGAFLPPLLDVPQVEAIAATAATGQINEPRLGGLWAESLAAMPTASFRELAVDAAARVEAYYRDRRLGQPEQPQLLDRDNGQVVAVRSLSLLPTPTGESADAGRLSPH